MTSELFLEKENLQTCKLKGSNVLIAQYFASRKPLCRDQSFWETGFSHFGTTHESPGQNGLVHRSPLSNMSCTAVGKRCMVRRTSICPTGKGPMQGCPRWSLFHPLQGTGPVISLVATDLASSSWDSSPGSTREVCAGPGSCPSQVAAAVHHRCHKAIFVTYKWYYYKEYY